MIPLRMAQLSNAAYHENQPPSFDNLGFVVHAEIDKGGCQCYVLGCNGFNVIVFRGTDTTRDWLRNFSLSKVKSSFGKVHKGFSESLDAVWPELRRVVQGLAGKPFIITGHSKGAAEATLCIERIVSLRNPYVIMIEAHLFGSPRVGNRTFAKNYAKANVPTFRYVNNNDIVTRVPSCFRFKHVGHLVYFDRNGKRHDGWTRGNIIVDRLMGRLSDLADGAHDHSSSDYVALLS